MRTTVGPLAPEVYWRRRLLALGLLVIALLMLRSVVGGDASGASHQVAKPTSRPDGTATHPYLPSTSPTPKASAVPTPSPSPSPSASASPSPSASPRPLAIGPCADASLQLVAATDSRAYRLGVTPKLSMTVRNTGAQPCRRDLGSTARELTIISGTAHTWSSADCQHGGGAELVLLRPGIAQTYAMTWPGRRSEQSCAGAQPVATAGTYQLQARLGSLVSNRVVFALS